MGRSVATLVGRSVATLVERNAIWVGFCTEQGGEVGARGDSRSREVRLKHGGFTEQGGEVEARGVSRSREKGVENTEI